MKKRKTLKQVSMCIVMRWSELPCYRSEELVNADSNQDASASRQFQHAETADPEVICRRLNLVYSGGSTETLFPHINESGRRHPDP